MMHEDAATVVRDVPIEALAAIEAAQAAATSSPPPALGASETSAAPITVPPAAAAPTGAAAVRGKSAFGGLSKKMTLIGTAPPANWPPRGADASLAPAQPPVAKSESAKNDEDAPELSASQEAPEVQATESEGDLDALLGDESSIPAAGRDEDRESPASILTVAKPVAAQPAIRASAALAGEKSDAAGVALEKKKSGGGLKVVAFIALWLMLLAAIWFVYKMNI